MKPFKNILVAVDFSSHSDEAVRIAADLSRRYEGTLTLVYVFQPVNYPMPEGYVLYTPNQVAELTGNFERLLAASKKMAEAAGAVGVRTRLLQGLVTMELLEFARTERADLIVMGTHGRTGLAHALLGSVAERVLRKASCPVLTVRTAEPQKA
jgi:nucleotide-binding universal stress UspA family protein